VTLTVAFDATDGAAAAAVWWPSAVAVASAFNVAKWTLVRAGTAIAGALTVAVAADAIKGKPHIRGASDV
jgi:hypothetical protein